MREFFCFDGLGMKHQGYVEVLLDFGEGDNIDKLTPGEFKHFSKFLFGLQQILYQFLLYPGEISNLYSSFIVAVGFLLSAGCVKERCWRERNKKLCDVKVASTELIDA